MKRLLLLTLSLAVFLACTSTATPTGAPKTQATASRPTAAPLVATPTPTQAVAATAVPPPTATTTPAPAPPTVGATATALPANCLKLQYVADVTIPDGTRLDPGANFVKTWRIRNSGQCAWENVNLVFSTGDPLAGETTAIPATAAGATVEVSVNLTAPSSPGRYQGAWSLQSNATMFGKLTVVIISGNPVVAQPTAAATRVVQPAATVTSAPPPQPQPTSAPVGCCKYCDPAKSKPCGDSCIGLSKTCHQSSGCACSK